MIVPQNLKDECQAELERCHAIAVKKYPTDNIPLPRMVYTQGGRTAGTYNTATKLIRINPVLLVENVREMVDNTVSHEFAHCADIHVNGVQYKTSKTGRTKRIVHGVTFKRFQMLFGRSTSTTHNMDTSSSSRRKSTKVHVWRCGCGRGEVKLTAFKHQRMLIAAPNGFGTYMRGHTAKRCGVYTYAGKNATKVARPVVAAQPQAIAARTTPVAPVAKPTKPWKEVAVEVYGRTDTRQQFIATMVALGLKKSTASTYHYNCNSGKWV